MLAALEKLARDRLGESAEIVRDVPGVGGVTGQRKGARVDYTLPALAERVLATIDVGDLSS